MFKFFDAIISFIGTVVDFVVGFFKSIILLFTTIGNAFVYVTVVIGSLPVYVLATATVIIAISVLYLLTNRG